MGEDITERLVESTLELRTRNGKFYGHQRFYEFKTFYYEDSVFAITCEDAQEGQINNWAGLLLQIETNDGIRYLDDYMWSDPIGSRLKVKAGELSPEMAAIDFDDSHWELPVVVTANPIDGITEEGSHLVTYMQSGYGYWRKFAVAGSDTVSFRVHVGDPSQLPANNEVAEDLVEQMLAQNQIPVSEKATVWHGVESRSDAAPEADSKSNTDPIIFV